MKTNKDLVETSIHAKFYKTLLSLGNLDTVGYKVKLKIDYSKPGLNKSTVKVLVPYVEYF